MEKNCDNCLGKFKGCMLKDNITTDIEDSAECKLEDGIFEEVIREQLDLTDLFIHMQEEGIIKKNANIKSLIQDDTIMNILTETLSDCIGSFIRRQVKEIEPKFYIDVDADFNCSYWR